MLFCPLALWDIDDVVPDSWMMNRLSLFLLARDSIQGKYYSRYATAKLSFPSRAKLFFSIAAVFDIIAVVVVGRRYRRYCCFCYYCCCCRHRRFSFSLAVSQFASGSAVNFLHGIRQGIFFMQMRPSRAQI